MKTKQEQIEEMAHIMCEYYNRGFCANGDMTEICEDMPDCCYKNDAEALYDAGYRKVENVYIIVSPEGGIALNMYTGKGTVYNDKAKAEEALRRKNEWAKTKGYGIYELVELEVEYDKCNC